MASQKFQVVRLLFNAPLHLSRGQTDTYDKSEEIIHSDTLKSAIFVAARMLFGNKADESFFDVFRISSAFMFHGNEYFFPKPMIKLKINFVDEKLEESQKSKRLKKLTWISHSVFEQLINDKSVDVTENQFSENGRFLFNKIPATVFTSEIQQRLAMPVGDETDGTPYYVERIYFNRGCGLYFLINYDGDKGIRNKLEAALKLLGDEGIGTDKHIGNGTFTADWGKELTLQVPENANRVITLSLYLPKQSEITKAALEESSWQLLKRGGYIASPENLDFLTYRKKSVFMFSESSVFPASMAVKGKKTNLKPENINGLNHAIWRDGTAFLIPIK